MIRSITVAVKGRALVFACPAVAPAAVDVRRLHAAATGGPGDARCVRPDHVHLILGALPTCDIVTFVGEFKQYREYGMKLPVLGMVTTTEESSLKSMGDEALGVITAGTYSAALDTPANRKWVQAMRAEYKEDPGYCTIGGYLGALFLEAGMKAVNGRIEDKRAFMTALRSIRLDDTPQGAIRLDPYGNPIVNIYIRRVERRDGRLVNAVIDSYPDVSQFWKYEPAAFLAAPVYSRDYPPAKNIE